LTIIWPIAPHRAIVFNVFYEGYQIGLLEMMPDGVLEYWSIGVMESIKPVSKKNSSMIVLC
jgi:hypothetical protein